MKSAVLILALALTGCQFKTPRPPIEDDTCGASRVQHLIGQRAAVLLTMRGLQPLRVISPGQPITKDYRLDRLNVDLDEANKITRVWCG